MLTHSSSVAYPSVHHRCLRPSITTILDRPCARSHRAQRIHFHELVPHTGALHSQIDEQTGYDGPVVDHSHWRLRHRPVHLCAGAQALA